MFTVSAFVKITSNVLSYVTHLDAFHKDFTERFEDLLNNLQIPQWIINPYNITAMEKSNMIMQEKHRREAEVQPRLSETKYGNTANKLQLLNADLLIIKIYIKQKLPISPRPSSSTAYAEVSEVRPISPRPSTSAASAKVSGVRPISPSPLISVSDPTEITNGTHEPTPLKKLPSCAVERPISAPPNIPSPFKRNLFWPNPEGVTPKRLKRERLPAVTTSPQVMAYFKSKEEKKKALET
ncbi:unnamed protein product [Psylliodes chrysocephalus]|uniref:Uncharacterized protein n=1 Tax=Psylliodes chrysocephalus TaxID=3402493 RepID=A0A9P0CC80_9CUCU|nr:unnamed protein product [Psylliodes chrysocephala]